MFSRRASGRERYSAFIGNIVKGYRKGNEQRMDVNIVSHTTTRWELGFSFNHLY